MPRLRTYRQGLGTLDASARERKAFYNGKRWVELRRLVLLKHPLCKRCLAEGRVVEATVVHHVIERLERPDLAYDVDNLESVCGTCHTAHHARKRSKQSTPPGVPST